MRTMPVMTTPTKMTSMNEERANVNMPLRDTERTTLLGLFVRLEETTTEINKLVDGTLPPHTQARWTQLRRSIAILAADLRQNFGGWL